MAQIDTLTEVNKAIEAQKKLLLDVSKVMKNQLDISLQLKAAAIGGGDVAKTAEAYKNLSGMLDGASEAAEKHEKGLNNLGNMSEKVKKQMLGIADGSDKAGKSLGIMSVAAAGVRGAFKGLEFTTNVMSGLDGLIGTVGSAMWDLAKTVIAFPFALWDGLFSKAAGLAANTEWRQALENIRKEFGNLATGASKAMIDMTHHMRGALDETGLRVRRIFGNRAEILTWITGVAKSMGNMFQLLRDKGQLADKDVERFGALYKGLGVSEEGMKAVAREALLSGKTVVAQMTDMANYAIQMGKAYGINAKEISKDMQSMMLDLKHFGGLSKKAMSEASIYARKLGMDVKDLAGLLDTFDTLDAGMEASAKLNQTLGLNLNGLELMNAAAKGGPTEVAEAVRKSMKEQGFSIATLNRQQQNMMASTLGLTNEQLQLMDVQNKGASLDDIKKKGAAAQKAQLSQAEATHQLASSIERLVKTMEPLQKGLFAAFFDGFQKGVFRSYEFRKILLEIRQVLWIVTRAGRELGYAFVQMFPGVKDIFKGIQDFFSPDRWRKMMRKVINTFKEFFTDMQNNPEAGLKKLFESLKKIFFNHFDRSNPAGMKIIEGFKTFFTSILKAVIGGAKAMIPVVMEALTNLLKGITKFLKGGIPDSFTKGASGIGDQILVVLSDLWKTIKKSWPALKEAAIELLTYLKDTIWNWAMEHKMLIASVLGIMMAPSIIGAIVSSSMTIFGGLFVKGLLGTTKMIAGSPAVKEGFKKVFGGLNSTAGSANSMTSHVSAVKPPGGEAPSVGKTLKWAAYIAGAMTVLIAAVVGLAVLLKTYAPNLTAAQVGLSLLVIGGAAAILAELSLVAVAVKLGSSVAGSAMSGMWMYGLFVGAATLLIAGIVLLMGSIPLSPTKMLAGAAAMGIITVVLLAMAPLALAAIAFAAVIGATGGLIGGGILAAGLAAMGAFAVDVVEIAKKIIKAAAQIDISGGIETKVKLVISIMNALSGFATAIGSILKSIPTTPDGDMRKFNSAINRITRFVTDIKETVKTFAVQILAIASALDTSSLSKVSIVVEIIRSLTSMLGTLGSVLNNASANASIIDSAAAPLDNMTTAMENIFRPGNGPMVRLVRIIGLVIGLFKNLPTVEPANLKAMSEAVVPVMTGITSMISSLAASSKNFKKEQIETVTKYIKDISNSMFGAGDDSSIIVGIRNILNAFVDAAVMMDETQLPKIQAFAEILSGLFGALSSILEVIAPLASNPILNRPAGTRIKNMEAMGELITTVLNSVKQFLPDVVKGILEVTSKISDVKGLSSKITILKSVVEFIGSLTGVLNQLNWTAKGADDGDRKLAVRGLTNLFLLVHNTEDGLDIFQLLTGIMLSMSKIDTGLLSKVTGLPPLKPAMNKIKAIAEMFGSIGGIFGSLEQVKKFSSTGLDAGKIIMAPLVNILKEIGRGPFKEALGGLGGIDMGQLTKASTIFYKISSMAYNIASAAYNIKKATANLKTKGGGDAMVELTKFLGGDENSGLIGMIGKVNQINLAMANMTPINVGGKLDAVGTILGVSGQKLQIRNQGFTVAVNFNVSMDAIQIENILAERGLDTTPNQQHKSRFSPGTFIPLESSGDDGG